MRERTKITIKDVAKEAGVSISVVSYVLNHSKEKSISEETKQRVLAAAKRLNYIPNRIASGMRNKKSMSIGLVSYWDIEGSIFMKMLSGIYETASKSGYSVVFCSPESGREDFSYLDYFRNRTVDGIIFISPYEARGLIDEVAHINRMKEAGSPFIMINGRLNLPDVNYINIDFYGSAYLATKYLIEKGHKDITFVAPLSAGYTEIKQRQAGYRFAMKESCLQENICDITDASKQLNKLKAIVADKSGAAHNIMVQALKQGVSIPNDLAIIACNTEPYSEFLFPPLSTVKIPAKEIGALAAKRLLSAIKGEGEYQSITLPCCLQLRQST